MRKIGIILLVALFSACDSNKVFEENIALENHIWNLENHPKFQVEIMDTTSEMNLLVNVRHSAHYPFSNLWVFVNTTHPEGAIKIDTLECVLAAKDGKWLGSGLGDIWDIQCQFKSYRFLKQGIYTFEIEQAMRHGDLAKIEQLPGIMEIGLRIEKQDHK